MGTVGEMVFAEPAPFRPEGEDDNAQTGAAMVVDRLKSLGIWDAEVLDCEFQGFRVRQKGDPTFDGVPIFWDPDAWFWTQLAQGRTEGTFRIIVLPKESPAQAREEE